MLSESQKGALLRIARESVECHLAGDQLVVGISAPLPHVSGVFVTIKRAGALRGCLGVLEMRGSLAEEVARCARDSATADPRFPPMSVAELADTSLEISVLGPLEEIDPRLESSVEMGRHGLVIEQGPRRGLLLPQVAIEWRWTREQFLRQTCRKAGLPRDAWQNGARVFRFDAEVFGE
jgi:AmmeMemoRadiSam system protein A